MRKDEIIKLLNENKVEYSVKNNTFKIHYCTFCNDGKLILIDKIEKAKNLEIDKWNIHYFVGRFSTNKGRIKFRKDTSLNIKTTADLFDAVKNCNLC